MSDFDLAINCWILGHEYDPFQVKISRNENVIALKLAIKTTNQNTLKNIDAQSLVLYKISIPYAPQFAEQAAALELNELRLSPLGKLSEVFADELHDTHVHVVVVIPSRVWVYVVLSSLR